MDILNASIGLHKIFVHLFLCVQESITSLYYPAHFALPTLLQY